MSNEETLQEYNERLEENNVSLANVLTNIKNLPSSGGGSSSDVYSTEETVIGTWIDGKPLYRKVISVDVSSFTTEVNNIDYDFSTLDMAIDVRAILERQFNIIEVIPRTASSKNIDKWYGGIQLDKPGNKFIVELGTTLIERVNKGYRFFIIFEYTKTTD